MNNIFLDYLQTHTGCDEDTAITRLIEIERFASRFIDISDKEHFCCVNREFILALIALYCEGYKRALKEKGE